jgi:hypothetical protein
MYGERKMDARFYTKSLKEIYKQENITAYYYYYYYYNKELNWIIIDGYTAFLLSLDHFSSFLILYTDSRAPSVADLPVVRPPPTHRTTQIGWTHTDIYALSWFQFHEDN